MKSQVNDMWIEAQKYLLNLKVGEGYNGVTVTKRTANKIHLSTGVIVSIKKSDAGFLYLDSRSVIRGKKPYPIISQVLRDIEGYLIYLIHSQPLSFKS